MGKEENSIKIARLSLVISCMAVMIASFNVAYSGMNGLQIAAPVAILASMLSIMSANLLILNRRKKQISKNDKDKQEK